MGDYNKTLWTRFDVAKHLSKRSMSRREEAGGGSALKREFLRVQREKNRVIYAPSRKGNRNFSTSLSFSLNTISGFTSVSSFEQKVNEGSFRIDLQGKRWMGYGFFLEIDSRGIFERLRVLEFLICGIRLFAIFVINLSYFRKCIFVLSRSILFVCCSVFENFKDSRII